MRGAPHAPLEPEKQITRLADNLHFLNGITLSPDEDAVCRRFRCLVLAVPIESPGVPTLIRARRRLSVGGWERTVWRPMPMATFTSHYRRRGRRQIAAFPWSNILPPARACDHQRCQRRVPLHHRSRQERSLASRAIKGARRSPTARKLEGLLRCAWPQGRAHFILRLQIIN